MENVALEDQPVAKTYNILYVDDEESNLRIFRMAFKRHYNVYTTTDIEEAVRILDDNNIHLIMTDQKMPEMNGTELLERILPAHPDIIRIILTGFSDIEAIVQAVNKCGIYKYITKPYESGEMKMTLDKALETYELKNEKQILIKELKSANDHLEEKVRERTNELEIINLKITDSIKYARRIQRAMLPAQERVTKHFKDMFIFYSPKDIVSGDFYWFAELTELGENKVIIAAVDCTGHGVPGAFMSMIGESILNSAVFDKNMTNPIEILNYLMAGVSSQLNQEETSNRDGMDIGIVVIDKFAKTMTFSGGRQDLLYIENGETKLIKGENVSIGGLQSDKPFVNHVVSLETPITFFMYSDGYQDQFGGENNRKFSSGKLRAMLTENAEKPCEEQRNILVHTLDAWMVNEEKQIDDIMVMGFKL